jgi:serine/threonine protein kinase
VHQALATIDGTPNTMVAIKLIDKRAKGEYIERFMERELNIIKRLAHPNIVRVWGEFREI